MSDDAFKDLAPDERVAIDHVMELSLEILHLLLAKVGARLGLIKCVLRCALMLTEDFCAGSPANPAKVAEFILMEYRQDRTES